MLGEVFPLELTKSHHKPYEAMSWVATGLFFTVLINIGLAVGIARQCKVLMKLWIVHGVVMCVLGVYLTILNTFGTYSPLWGHGAMTFLSVILYTIMIVLVAIFHDKGDMLVTAVNSHHAESQQNLIPDFN